MRVGNFFAFLLDNFYIIKIVIIFIAQVRMPFKPPVLEKCQSCSKSVYSAEERLAGGHKWHNFCFKCGMLYNTMLYYVILGLLCYACKR